MGFVKVCYFTYDLVIQMLQMESDLKFWEAPTLLTPSKGCSPGSLVLRPPTFLLFNVEVCGPSALWTKSAAVSSSQEDDAQGFWQICRSPH